METTKSIELGLITAGRKGVTNKQMLEAFKLDLVKEQLIQLLNDYPQVFMASVKYTPDAKKIALEKIAKENGYPEFTVKTGKKIRNQEEVVEEQKEENLLILDNYKNKNNAKLAAVAEKYKALSEEEQQMVKAMVEKDLGISEIAKQYGLTKDQAYNKVFRSKNSIYNKLAQAN